MMDIIKILLMPGTSFHLNYCNICDGLPAMNIHIVSNYKNKISLLKDIIIKFCRN